MEEATESESFLDQIKPPRLEDAGLEDCALPPESIEEAFLKAASAVRSFVSESDDEDEKSSEALVGIAEGPAAPSGGRPAVEISGTAVVPGDAGGKSGPSVSPESAGTCLDALKELEIGEKSRVILGKEIGRSE